MRNRNLVRGERVWLTYTMTSSNKCELQQVYLQLEFFHFYTFVLIQIKILNQLLYPNRGLSCRFFYALPSSNDEALVLTLTILLICDCEGPCVCHLFFIYFSRRICFCKSLRYKSIVLHNFLSVLQKEDMMFSSNYLRRIYLSRLFADTPSITGFSLRICIRAYCSFIITSFLCFYILTSYLYRIYFFTCSFRFVISTLSFSFYQHNCFIFYSNSFFYFQQVNEAYLSFQSCYLVIDFLSLVRLASKAWIFYSNCWHSLANFY